MHKRSIKIPVLRRLARWLTVGLCCSMLMITSSPGRAAVENEPNAPALINPFSSNYLYFAAVKNTPLQQTAETLQGGYLTYLIGYRHNINGDWIMGLNVSFKSLKRKDRDDQLSYLTLTHEALYVIRLSHPFYLFVGGKFMYLYPTHKNTLPLTPNTDFDLEIGTAAALAIARHIDPRTMVSIEVNRWRGTKTNHIHGTEVAIGINRALK